MNNLPFSEKYRPRKLEDLIIDKIIYNKIKNIYYMRTFGFSMFSLYINKFLKK
jgi:hypothetical protein